MWPSRSLEEISNVDIRFTHPALDRSCNLLVHKRIMKSSTRISIETVFNATLLGLSYSLHHLVFPIGHPSKY